MLTLVMQTVGLLACFADGKQLLVETFDDGNEVAKADHLGDKNEKEYGEDYLDGEEEKGPPINTETGSCQFTRDCKEYRHCQMIADASCVCNFGSCVISGGYGVSFGEPECSEYTDCACKNNTESCFCRSGFCEESRWECHEAADCKKLDKCQARDCACSGNLCESDCAEDGDCEDFHCNKALGYFCKCENNLCAYKQKDKECKSITECVSQGKCTADKPCDCLQDYCTLPWWLTERDQPENCRSDIDCETTILDCQGNKCSCQNRLKIDGYWNRVRGNCAPVSRGDNKKND